MNTDQVRDDTLARPADRTDVSIHRRALLSGAGIAAAAAASMALVEPARAFDATPAENAPRYKESEHVKTFYRLVGR